MEISTNESIVADRYEEALNDKTKNMKPIQTKTK
jgi:hypothetical protein